MGAYEGAGITVLAKGVEFPATDPIRSRLGRRSRSERTFLTVRRLLGCEPQRLPTNPFPSNFQCNPSSIDGLTVHEQLSGRRRHPGSRLGHNLQIANNRVNNNQGTLSGGITVGQGEHPDAYLVGGTVPTDPGSCVTPDGTRPRTWRCRTAST